VIERHAVPEIDGLPGLGALDPRQREMVDAATSEVQLRSKRWLIEQVDDLGWFDDALVLVLGGWCGILPLLMYRESRSVTEQVVSIDLDADACVTGKRALAGDVPGLSFVCANVLDIDYARLSRRRRVVVVNTICEHLAAADFVAWRKLLPRGQAVVLQSNDYRGCGDHVNCVDSVHELARHAHLAEIAAADSLDLGLFTRFMVAGRS
jgi:hypothetical protein